MAAKIKPDYIVLTEGGGIMLNRPRLFSDEEMGSFGRDMQFPITDSYKADVDEWVRVAYPVTDGEKYVYQIVSDGRSMLQIRIPKNKYDENWEKYLVAAIKDYELKNDFYQKKRAKEKNKKWLDRYQKKKLNEQEINFNSPVMTQQKFLWKIPPQGL